MIAKPLPKFIQPLRLAEREIALSGKLLLADFPRLAEFITHQQGEIEVELRFGEDEQRIAYVTGTITACLPLKCQRCFGMVEYTLELTLNLAPVLTETAANKLPERYDPLLLAEDQILLITVIEDELLLGLPFAPRHEQLDCNTRPLH